MPVLCCCLFLSGAAGLANEVLWTRILGLSFGHTTYAVTTVLAVYMGGLALGSRFLGELADRVSRPLRLYGILEIGIGLYCLAAPGLLASARKIYVTADFIPDGSSLHAVLRVALAFLVLIVPTTLMGGTLPAVSRALIRDREEAGRKIGILYGVNTLGAATGAFAVGYRILPALGIRMTNFLGVGASLLAGAVVLFLFRGETPVPASPGPAFGDKPGPTGPTDRMLLWSIAACGAVGMSYQIVWVRALVLVIGSSTYAFSAILVNFLLGIALGSLVFARFHARNGFRFFALLQFGIAASASLLLPAFHLLPRSFFSLFRSFEASHRYVELIQFLLVAPIVLLPTTLMGMTFPSLTGLLARRPDRIGGDVGRYYAWNTVGAIAGSVLTGFLLIPRFGAQNTLAAGILTNTTLGCALFLCTVPSRRRVHAVIAALAVLPLLFFPRWDRRLLSSGVFYLVTGARDLADLTTSRIEEILFFREGISSTITVTRDRNGPLSLLVNGKVDASTGDDLETQVNLATIPLLLHPEPRRVCIIGLGSGVTAGMATLFRIPERIDIVELEPAVRDASEFFRRENFDVLEDPRVHLHIGDGRSFVEKADSPFDVVISEPSNPWMRGIANLYTREFFGTIREKLHPNGVFCQWVQGYAISPEDLKMIARTFLEAFPDATLWLASEGDLILLGRKNGSASVDLDGILARADGNPRLVDAYRPYGKSPADGLIAGYVLDPGNLRRYAGSGPLNSDDLPLLEFSAPRSLYLPPGLASNRKEIFRYKTGDFPYFLQVRPSEAPALHHRIGRYLLRHNRVEDAGTEIAKAAAGLDPSATRRARPARMRSIAMFSSSGILEESFDGNAGRLPLFPHLGGYRPDDERRADLALWNLSMEEFAEISGVREGAGVGGSSALIVRSVAGVVTSGYYVPLAVRPSTTYRVEFHMKSMLAEGEDAGAGVLEYDALLPSGEEFTMGVIRDHRAGGKDYIRIRGRREWEPYAFTFTTSPRTRMAHLLFFREGPHSRNPVVFDDIRIREIR